jgi:hypothetical protein
MIVRVIWITTGRLLQIIIFNLWIWIIIVKLIVLIFLVIIIINLIINSNLKIIISILITGFISLLIIVIVKGIWLYKLIIAVKMGIMICLTSIIIRPITDFFNITSFRLIYIIIIVCWFYCEMVLFVWIIGLFLVTTDIIVIIIAFIIRLIFIYFNSNIFVILI